MSLQSFFSLPFCMWPGPAPCHLEDDSAKRGLIDSPGRKQQVIFINEKEDKADTLIQGDSQRRRMTIINKSGHEDAR